MKTFMVQASLTIVTYDPKNMFIVQATGVFVPGKPFQPILMLSGKAEALLSEGAPL
jgi:hypothetical protein